MAGIPGVYRAERGPADVGENEPVHLVFAGLLGDLRGRHVPAGPSGEPDRAIPAGRFGEHQVHSGRPGGEGPEFRCPGGGRGRDVQQVPPGGVAGVGDRVRLDKQVSYRGGIHAR